MTFDIQPVLVFLAVFIIVWLALAPTDWRA